jgi:hypothetical protein
VIKSGIKGPVFEVLESAISNKMAASAAEIRQQNITGSDCEWMVFRQGKQCT